MKPTRGGLLSGLVAATLLLVLPPSISLATFPGANGRIAFVNWRWEEVRRPDILSVLPNGLGLQNLTDSPGRSEGDPSWSADGRLIAFTRGDGDAGEAVEVWTMRADGTHQRQVTDDSLEQANPGFSPSGRRIVYYTTEVPYYGRGSIWKVRPDGLKKRPIVGPSDGFFPTQPIFSPTGRRIGFEGRPNGRGEGIWKVKPDGSHLDRLTNPPGRYTYDTLLDWSPDGRHILFYRCTEQGDECNGGNWVMRPDGSHERPVDSFGRVYSPRGGRFAFASGEHGVYGYRCLDIYTIRRNGSDRRQLTQNCEDFNIGGPGTHASDPSWQPIPVP